MELKDKHCRHQVSLLTNEEIDALLPEVANWDVSDDSTAISQTFHFTDFKQTMGFVNDVADIVNEQDHHPELYVTYNRCSVTFSTHSVGGLTENDFICAARINAIGT